MLYPFNQILLVGSLLLFVAILASKTSGKMGIPALILFIGIGMFAGSDVLGIYFDNATVAQNMGIVALTLILFSGGLDTNWQTVKPVLVKASVLSTLGVLITTFSVGLFVHYISDFTFLEGLLLGAIVSSTDAAAVFSILRNSNIGLKGRIRPLLELESGSNDPMAYFLTISFTYLLTNKQASPLELIPDFFMQMIIGAGIGVLMGFAILKILNSIMLDIEGLYAVLMISLVFFTYSISHFLHGNGFLAIYITGIILGNRNFIHKRTLLRFYDGQAWLVQIVMFILMGLLVFPMQLVPVMGIGLVISLFLMFIARPLGVFISLSLIPKSNLREKTFISWVGLRGAVPIIFATYPLIAGVSKANLIFNIVFFIVLTSVLLQGTTMVALAKFLKVYVPARIKRNVSLDIHFENEIKNELVEIIVPERSPGLGKAIMDLKLPVNSLIALIERDHKYLQPKGTTKLEKGDKLFILTKKPEELELISKEIISAK